MAAFKVLGVIPGGETIHGLLQKRVTKGFSIDTTSVEGKADVGAEILASVFAAFDPPEARGFLHIDVGSGWTPTVPLCFYSAGFDRQLLCDIEPALEIDAVAEVVQLFRRIAVEHHQLAQFCERLPPPVARGEPLEDYLRRLGIEYVAPYRMTDLSDRPGRKIITCTQALLYIPPDEMSRLFNAVSVGIADGGLFIASTHLYDMYSEFDKSLSPYNKWRYSDFVWEKLINSRMMHFNRLTPAGYRGLLEGAELELREFTLTEPSDADLAALRKTTIHPKFQHVPPRELAARTLRIVASKRNG